MNLSAKPAEINNTLCINLYAKINKKEYIMHGLSDVFTLNNGYKIPCLGFGTYLAENEVLINAVKEAINIGYRLIDTAAFYNNEKALGDAIKNSGIAREQLFVTSKVWNTDRGYKQTKAAFEKTMEKLKLDYLDLYLIHWPANKKQFNNAEEINAETWKAMEELYLDGRIKAIGLSNFLPHHIEELKNTAQIMPMVNQIEFHPGFTQMDTVKYCQRNNIIVEAWSPLGRKEALANDIIKSLAKKYEKTPAQIILRWIIQQNIIPLPKSVTASRILENSQIFDFELDNNDIEMISSIPQAGGECANPDEVDF